MILITGSAGKTGRSVLKALVEREVSVRALVHRPDQVPLVKSLGAQQVLVGDMRSSKVIQQAVQGVQAVYHICPNMSADELPIGVNVIESARSTGVQHFGYHSVLKPQVKSMPHHWNKMLVEEYLLESHMPYTILQPAAYMQNLAAHWESFLHDGIYPVPYPADTRLSLVDLVDVAQAAAIVLTEPGHRFATYELVSTEGLSQTQVAGILSQQLERKITAERVPIEEWRHQAKAAGLGNYQVDTLVKMFTYYEQYGFEGNSNVLTWLLGHPPRSLQAFIQRLIESKHLKQQATIM
ncbi:MAG: NmrA family NAD(P)-binding protein [Anaerolineales bacterium]